MKYCEFMKAVRDADPIVPEAQIVRGEHWRIGVITDSLIRLEWSDDGLFEDRPTQTVFNRNLHVEVHVQVTRYGDGVVVDTPALRLTYDGAPFSREGLSIVVKGVPASQFNTWHYGDDPNGNLRGTRQTLDECNGEVPVGLGILSRDGWAVLDDTSDNVLAEVNEVNGEPNPFGVWPQSRGIDGAYRDLYFFGYGLRFTEAMADYYRVTGPTPLLPRWALGNWWSRFYRYSQDEYLELMQRFQREGIPFSVSVIDMDWHVTDVDPKYGSGWTGYTWNTKLFPDHRTFLEQLHDLGLHVTLNEHPRDGIRAFEDEYVQVARDVGVDPASEQPVEFDPSSPRFMDAYMDLHHRMAADGIDFWWIDWQQGGVTRQRGLDPLWMLNYTQYIDSGRDGGWPLTFSRYAGPGSHRYPIGFSGDTVVTWESLDFQPRFTAMASNIGYGWWSHDIGGHMLGYRDDELEARWYQFGAFSPINRLHSSSSMFSGKEPWNFPEPVRSAMIRALRLRHELIPYLHSMNYRQAFGNRPLVEPMYWENPQTDAAYWYPNQYRYGTELIVAPITRPVNDCSSRARADLWFPQGEWFDFFTGRRYEARYVSGRRMSVYRGIGDIPVFAKAGAIVPLQILQKGNALNATANPKILNILVFPGDGDFEMIEDDGVFAHAGMGCVARTGMHSRWETDGSSRFVVDGVSGEGVVVDAAIPATRDWRITFRGVRHPNDATVVVQVGDSEIADGSFYTRYDDATLSFSVTVRNVPRRESLVISVNPGLVVAENPIETDVFRILGEAQMDNLGKDLAFDQIRTHGCAALASLRALDVQPGSTAGIVASHVPEPVIEALGEVLLRSQ